MRARARPGAHARMASLGMRRVKAVRAVPTTRGETASPGRDGDKSVSSMRGDAVNSVSRALERFGAGHRKQV